MSRTSGRRTAGVLVAALVGALLASVPLIAPGAGAIPGVPAPVPSAEPEEPSRADLRELARLLSDERVRYWLEREASESAGEADAAGEFVPQEWLGSRLAAIEGNAMRAVAAGSATT